MRTLFLLGAVFLLTPAAALAAEGDKSAASGDDGGFIEQTRALMFSGVRVRRLNEPGYPEMINYYHSVSVYQSRNRDFNNPLYVTTRRNEAGEQRIYRASELHIPLFRGRSDWPHLEMVDGIRINSEGESQGTGYQHFGLPAGDSGAGIAPLRFHETIPAAEDGVAASVGSTASGSGSSGGTGAGEGGGKTARPELPEHLRKAVRSGLVVRHFSGDDWGLFEPVYHYDDGLYVQRDKQRYRVLYSLEPMYPFPDERGQSWMVGFPAGGGPLALMPAEAVRVENGYLQFGGGGSAGQPPGAVTAFNAENCPEGWTEYEPAQGRFVRGIDKSGENIDPAGQREPGSTQGARIGWHQHELLSKHDGFYTKGAFRSHGTHGGRPFERKQKTTGTGGKETRPKNVALLYCEKE
jgi:hypothetical protein